MFNRLSMAIAGLVLAVCSLGTGCRVMDVGPRMPHSGTAVCDAPRELHKAILPPYIIEPPDILLVDAVHLQPKGPYRLRGGDALSLLVPGYLPDAPIEGVYPVQADGTIDLGFSYGTVSVGGMTREEAKQAIQEHLALSLSDTTANVTLATSRVEQQVAGEHLVAPDGTVMLGSYGSVLLVGMTLAEAKQAIEDHLAEEFDDPEVSVDVFAYNSKTYYIITQGAGFGDRVYRMPITGGDTVLDAISEINGLEQVSSKKIWIARAGRDDGGCHQILPVDWNAITQYGGAETNYQLFPGDRVYIAEDKLVAFDTALAKLISPLERIMGFTLLGTETVTRMSGSVLRGGGNPTGRR